jgi:UDP-N-acetylglucosamine 2-epimerase (non-hydrolysing)
VQLLEPVAYYDMLDLVDGAAGVVTDSGGLQEESTALGVPCLTVRENTERPITISEGTNRLVPNPRDLPDAVRAMRRPSSPRRPEGWDGHAGERVIEALVERTAVTAGPPSLAVA